MNPALGRVGDASEDVREPGEWINLVQFGRHDQRRDRCRSLGTALRPSKEPRLATERKAAQGAFSVSIRLGPPCLFERLD